jgi:glycosyltransferase involved in cell wall biosynthesis
MRIAFITPQYPSMDGGSHKYAAYITRELAALGHDITVFAARTNVASEVLEGRKNLRLEKVTVNDRYAPAAQFSFLLPKYIRQVERDGGEFDIVHFNGLCYWFFPKRVSSAPHVVTALHLVTDAIEATDEGLIKRLVHYSRETNAFMPFIEKRAFTNADYIVSISNFTKARVMDKYKIPPNRIETIYLGIEKSTYEFTGNDIQVFKDSIGLGGEMSILLFVGAVDDPRKGLDLLLKALRLVKEQTSVALLVVGPGTQTDAKKRAASLGISDIVLFLGSVDLVTLQKCYALCDVYVYPSRLEGFGLPLLEATEAGKPVVSTNVGAIPELVEHGINAFLTDPNERSIAKEIIAALKDKQGSTVTKQLSKTVLNNFSWERTAGLTSELYKKLIITNEKQFSVNANLRAST